MCRVLRELGRASTPEACADYGILAQKIRRLGTDSDIPVLLLLFLVLLLLLLFWVFNVGFCPILKTMHRLFYRLRHRSRCKLATVRLGWLGSTTY